MPKRVVTKQEVHWVPESRRVQLSERPFRVWTLFHSEQTPPALPIQPLHNVNAFLEDKLHDWNIDNKNMLRYYSRVALNSVWILVEYAQTK